MTSFVAINRLLVGDRNYKSNNVSSDDPVKIIENPTGRTKKPKEGWSFPMTVQVFVLLGQCVLVSYRQKVFKICYGIFFGQPHEYQSSTEKRQFKSEEEQKRSIFINLRQKHAIGVDKFSTFVQDNPNDQCPICQYSFNHGELCAFIKCGHLFHARCIRESFQVNLDEERQTCPICDDVIICDPNDINSGKFMKFGSGTSNNRGSLDIHMEQKTPIVRQSISSDGNIENEENEENVENVEYDAIQANQTNYFNEDGNNSDSRDTNPDENDENINEREKTGCDL